MPDERAIMTYVSSYYHCFAGKIKVNNNPPEHLLPPPSSSSSSSSSSLSLIRAPWSPAMINVSVWMEQWLGAQLTYLPPVDSEKRNGFQPLPPSLLQTTHRPTHSPTHLTCTINGSIILICPPPEEPIEMIHWNRPRAIYRQQRLLDVHFWFCCLFFFFLSFSNYDFKWNDLNRF